MMFIITIIGWFLFTLGEMEIRRRELKDDNNPDTNFRFKDHAGEKWITWIGSFFSALALLIIGKEKMNIDPLASLAGIGNGWNDLYLFGSGFVWDLFIFLINLVRKKFGSK